jgi:hypothetical protein
VAAAVLYLVFFFLPRMRSISTSLADLETKLIPLLAQVRPHTEIWRAQGLHYVDARRANAITERIASTVQSDQSNLEILSDHDQVQPIRLSPMTVFARWRLVQRQRLVLRVAGSCDLEALPTQVWIEEMKFQGPGKVGTCGV